MKGLELSKVLSDRLVDTYSEFKDRGLSMELYMLMIATHAATLISYQSDALRFAGEFCTKVMTSTYVILRKKGDL